MKELLGQNQFAQFGGLQAIGGAVVHDGNGFLATQQPLAVYADLLECAARMHGHTVCQDGLPGRNTARGRRRECGLHELCVAVEVVLMITILIIKSTAGEKFICNQLF